MPDKGVRKVQMDDTEKMKGLQNSKYSNITYQITSTSIEQHVYAAINMAIAPTTIAPRKISTPTFGEVHNSTASPSEVTTKPVSKWIWNVPDLKINGNFYQDRVKSLKIVIRAAKLNYHSTMKQGLKILEAHRSNYGPDGPKHLVLLW